MKKIIRHMAILFTLLVSVVFCACSSKPYSKLKMELKSPNNFVQLIMDSEYLDSDFVDDQTEKTSLVAQWVEIEFSGIKSSKIGKLNVSWEPLDLATIVRNVEISNGVARFGIQANKVGNGTLTVTHLASGKQLSVPLYVDKKAIGAESQGNSLVVNIPDAPVLEDGQESYDNYNYFVLDNKELIDLNPLDSTDNIIWNLSNNSNLTGDVEIINTLVDENFKDLLPKDILTNLFGEDFSSENILHKNKTIIKVSSSCAEQSFKLAPSINMNNENYEVIIPDFEINVLLTKLLTNENVDIFSNNAVTKSKNSDTNWNKIDSEIYLYHNDISLNSVNIDLCKTDISGNQTSLFADSNSELMSLYKNVFDNVKTSTFIQKDVITNAGNQYFQFTSTAISSFDEVVNINFVPNNAVGDIKTFTKTIHFVLTEVAESIQVKVKNELINSSFVDENTKEIETIILDNYTYKGNQFNFDILRLTTDESLQGFKIIVDKQYLSTNNHNIDITNNLGISNNKFLLKFGWSKSQDLKFVLSDNGDYFESPIFTKHDNIYLQYQTNDSGTNESLDFSFKVKNVYDNSFYGENENLDNSCKTLKVNVIKQKGVNSIDLTGGVVIPDGNGYKSESNGENEVNVLNSILYTKFAYDNLNEKPNRYFMKVGELLDANKQTISDTEAKDIKFTIKITKNDELVDIFDLYTIRPTATALNETRITESEFSIENNDGNNGVILYLKDGLTSIENGDYKIIIQQKDGGADKTFEFVYKVVSNVNPENIVVSPFDSDISNIKGVYEGLYYDYVNNTFVKELQEEQMGAGGEEETETQNLDENQSSKYFIVSTNKSIDTKIKIGKYINGKFVEDDSFIPYINGITVSSSVKKLNEKKTGFEDTEIKTKYIDYTPDRSNINESVYFNGTLQVGSDGTIIAGESYYVLVNFELEVVSYGLDGNFYQIKEDSSKQTVSFYFFVYEPVESWAFTNANGAKIETLTPFVESDLGYYFKSESQKTLYLNINNSINNNDRIFNYLNYEWSVVNTDPVIINVDKTGHSCRFDFKYSGQSSGTTNGYINCQINQYGIVRTISCYVDFQEVDLTDSLAVRNNVSVIDKNGQTEKYVYIKQKQDFKFNVEQIGKHTFDGVKYVVCDMLGNVYKDFKFDDNGDLYVLDDGIWKKPSESETKIKAGDYVVLIFATDWLKISVDDINSNFTFNFEDLSSILMDVDKDQVKKLVLKVRDGSQANPFLISSKEELKNLETGYYYELINDINMNNESINLGEVDYHLSSYSSYSKLTKKPSDWDTNYTNYYEYSVAQGYTKLTVSKTFRLNTYYEKNQLHFSLYNVRFDNKDANGNVTYKSYSLFAEVEQGYSLSNINFEYVIDGSVEADDIGVVGTNYGTLENLTVEFDINKSTQENKEFDLTANNIGMLVAVNRGEIVYTNNSLVVASGNANINVTQATNVGGLVGKNVGNITGVLQDASSTVEFLIYYEEQGAIFNGTINLTVKDDLTDTVKNNITLGGVAGYNLGTIKNVYVTGELNGYNNVGGIVGSSDTIGKQLNEREETSSEYYNSHSNNLYVLNEDIYTKASGYNSKTTYYELQLIDFGSFNIENGVDKLTIYNSQSSTKVTGNNSVGGIVGKDNYGLYYHTYYEVYDRGEDKTSVTGNDKVGGLIGESYFGKLQYCYFHSFRWNYKMESITNTSYDDQTKFENSEFYDKEPEKPDILGENQVGGLIGYANSDGNYYYGSDANRVYIKYCNVDAFIQGKTNVAGICYASDIPYFGFGYVQGCVITEDNSYGTVKGMYNAIYFIIEEEYEYYYLSAYLICKDNDTGEHIYSSIDNYSELGTVDGFTSNSLINNNRPYITYSGNPLVTQSPTSINLEGALSDTKVNGSMDFVDEDGNDADLPKTIMLNYYDLINNGGSNFHNDKKSINTINLDEFINKSLIEIIPNNIGGRFLVTSSAPSVVEVLKGGQIILKNEGIVTLTFTSIISSIVKDEITIIVRKVPTDYNIYNNSLYQDELEKINIVKGESSFIYDKYEGTKNVNGTDYSYILGNYNLISPSISKENDDSSTIDTNNVKINGLSVYETKQIKEYSSLVLSVDKYVDYDYKLTFAPYIYFELDGKTYSYKLSQEENFVLSTRQGVTNMTTNIVNTTMSVVDELNVELVMTTDSLINSVDVFVDVRYQDGTSAKIYNDKKQELSIYDLFVVNSEDDKIQFKTENNKYTLNFKHNTNNNEISSQIETFVLRLKETLRVEEDLFVTLTFYNKGVSTQIKFVLVPQDISSITATNYKDSKEQDKAWEKRQVVRPSDPAMIVVNVAPESAYFAYLEITDLSPSDKFKFVQFDSFDPSKTGLSGKALSQTDKISSDGFGIQLQKVEGNKDFYVYTLLDSKAQYNMVHRIKITAFSSSGKELGDTVLSLDAVLFPYVELNYYNAKDKLETSSNSLTINNNNTTNLALGVEAKIGAITKDNEGDIAWNLEIDSTDVSEYFNISLGADDYYYLRCTDDAFDENGNFVETVKGFINKRLVVSANVQRQYNGVLEISKTVLNFDLRVFTINGLSLKTDKTASGGRLGAVLGSEHTLEVYFNATDISFYNNGKYWNKVYDIDDTNKDGFGDVYNLLGQLNNIVSGDEVNGYNKNAYVDFLFKIDGNEIVADWEEALSEDRFKATVLGYDSFVSLTQDVGGGYKLKINSISMNNTQMGIALDYYYNTLGIPTVYSEGIESQRFSSENYYTFNISNVSTLFDYIAIKNAEEFNDMIEGGYYILTNDIVLNDYQVLDIPLGGFDGNGHTITINSFDYTYLASKYTDGIAYFCLFKEIYEGQIVKNVQLNYNLNGTINLCEYPISENVYYSTIYFGGIATNNNGIITNSIVNGEINFITTEISPSKFYVGGVVCNNGSSGYITNTICDLNIITGGVAGGFVYDNKGTIATSKFINAISSYVVVSSGYTDIISIAGFAVMNSGKISMSAVVPSQECISQFQEIFKTGGSIGGFVYINESNGSIEDCYLKDVTFKTSGSLGGFVHTSSGTIKRCYINATRNNLDEDRTKSIFIRENNSSKIENCYFVLSTLSDSNIPGLKCVTTLNISKESSFDGFIFTSNSNGVWQMTLQGPILLNNNLEVNIKEKAELEIKLDGETKVEYIVAGTKDIPYIIYNEETFNYYFNQHEDGVLYGYYRIVSDIDFKEKADLISSLYDFKGMLEGNNMRLYNFGLFSQGEANSESLGLFRTIGQNDDQTSFVSNLNLECINVRGSNSSSVGVLAGIIDSGIVYNININNPSLLVVGKNSVGALAGIIRGNFEINGIVSNVGVRSVFRNTDSRVEVYLGKDNTYTQDSNLANVSYAGGIVGILEGYDKRTQMDTILSNYTTLKNVRVDKSNLLIGETVGGIAGLVTKYSHLSFAQFNMGTNTHFSAVYNAGGLVGENRGIISNSKVLNSDEGLENALDKYYYENVKNSSVATGGIVAVNYGGLLYNVYNETNVVSYYSLGVTGGIVARNVNGTIVNAINKGFVYSLMIGGIAGADYSYSAIQNAGNNYGAISNTGLLVIPKDIVDYSKIKFDVAIEKDKSYQQISLNNLDEWFTIQSEKLDLVGRSINTYYSVNEIGGEYTQMFTGILGSIVGVSNRVSYDLSFVNSNISIKFKDSGAISFDNQDNLFIDNRAVGPTDASFNDSIIDRVSNGNLKQGSYYYIISMLKTPYDSPNLNNGYSKGVVRTLSTVA